MKKLLILGFAFLSMNNVMACHGWDKECTMPSSNTVVINNPTGKELYASISNAHCVSEQTLTKFNQVKMFSLSVNSSTQCNGRENLYYNINVYEDKDATKPVTSTKISLNHPECSSPVKTCSLKWERLESGANYSADYRIDGTIITVGISPK